MQIIYQEYSNTIKNPHAYHTHYAKYIFQHNHKHNPTIENTLTILKSFTDKYLTLKNTFKYTNTK